MITCDYNLFKNLLKKDQINFLNDLECKQLQVKNDIESAISKKEQIIKKLSKGNVKVFAQKPKDVREYVNSSEFSFESIETLLQNLTNLQLQYHDIEDMIIILGLHNENSDKETLERNVSALVEKISITKKFEEETKEDNEKYNLLINDFLNTPIMEKTGVLSPSDRALLMKDFTDNLVLKVSEKSQIVELPYTKAEVEKFLELYPNDYQTPEDVIIKEFTGAYSMYNKHPVLARFREAYYLSRTKEMKSIIDSFTFAKNMMFKGEINPTIIAAVKSQKQLEDYITCLQNNTLSDFPHFKIVFEVSPI